MRIVGGSLRGRRLAQPDDRSIRPTSDRARETLFNILAHRNRIPDARVLDVFAGTGALGCEAISRGAASVTFVENDARAARLISTNIAALKLDDVARIVKRSALAPGLAPGEFDLVFLDPPYGRGLGEQAIDALRKARWLAPDALIVLEEEAASLPDWIDGFERVDKRTIGLSAFGFFRHDVAERAP